MQNLDNDRGSFNIGRKCYNYKKCDYGVELVAGKVLDLFGIKHISYSPIEISGSQYCICDKIDYISLANAYISDSNNFNDICDYLHLYYPGFSDQLIEQLKKMYFIDLMLLNVGRQINTWGIVRGLGRKDICVIDNDLAFVHPTSIMTSCENPERSSLVEVENIINHFPDSDIDLFYSMFNTLTYDKLMQLMEEVEKKHGIIINNKYIYLDRFDTFRDQIKEAMKRKKKNNKLQKKES